MDPLEALRALITEVVRAELAQLAPPDDLLSTEQVAQHCGVAVGTVRRWVREGRLETLYAGRHLRIKRTEVDTMLAAPRLRGPRKRRPSPEVQAERMLRRRRNVRPYAL